MSRDWTPRELYEFEKFSIKVGHGSLWDFMKTTTLTINGETFPMVSEESISRRQDFPLLGRLFEEYDKLYSFLVQVNGGLELLRRHEEELDAYITTGQGAKGSPLIKWFEGELDPRFYYRETNDAMLLAHVQDEVGTLYRFDPSRENCFWFPLSADKCISVWRYPDNVQGDQLLMKLEQRAEDGSMGPHCQVLIDESLGTGSLSHDAIYQTLLEVYDCAGLNEIANQAGHELADKIMSVFGLKKRTLEEQLDTARSRTTQSSCPDVDARVRGERRD